LDTYHYGFFKFPNQDQEIPVVFKSKPDLKKGSEVLLEGKWAKSNGNRPSFTCQDYQILSSPPPLTTKILREQIQPLLTTSIDKKQEWNQRTDFLFRKLEELKKLEELTKLGKEYLAAHLLLKNAEYSSYHDGKLKQENFNQEKYLERIATEISHTEKRMKAADWKEEALDNFASKSIAITTQALEEKDKIIKELQQKLANYETKEGKKW
jgi:hypothetical protein